jgi:hypothetical protein
MEREAAKLLWAGDAQRLVLHINGPIMADRNLESSDLIPYSVTFFSKCINVRMLKNFMAFCVVVLFTSSH